jgi:hypothetical protein
MLRFVSKFLDVLATVVGNSIASAMSEPNNPPSTAEPRFWTVYENVTPPMVRAWRARREPAAKAWFVAIPDLRKLGTTIPAMNKVTTTSLKSCRTERALCIFLLSPPFSGWTVGWC